MSKDVQKLTRVHINWVPNSAGDIVITGDLEDGKRYKEVVLAKRKTKLAATRVYNKYVKCLGRPYLWVPKDKSVTAGRSR